MRIWHKLQFEIFWMFEAKKDLSQDAVFFRCWRYIFGLGELLWSQVFLFQMRGGDDVNTSAL